MLNMILTLIVVSIPVYMLCSVVYGYMSCPTNLTVWEKLVDAFKGSATIAWSRLNALSIAAIGLVGEVAPLIGAPGVKEQLERFMTPTAMGVYMLVVLIGAEIARRRTLA
jgi:hypothetical protein